MNAHRHIDLEAITLDFAGACVDELDELVNPVDAEIVEESIRPCLTESVFIAARAAWLHEELIHAGWTVRQPRTCGCADEP